MVVVGGMTRLTGSGLSIVEWRPVTGWLPPLNEAAWQEAFARYQTSPQFQLVNRWMQLADFQRIFFWEYVHRVLGRAVFFVAFVPWLYWAITGKLRRLPMNHPVLLSASVWVLVALQGVLGWFMVMSGLSAQPAVSHFRLAAHLCLAFFLAQWVLWMWLSLRPGRSEERRTWSEMPPNRNLYRFTIGFISLLVVQIVYGAFVGGTRAGYMFKTFPDMAGHYLPGPFFSDTLLQDLLYAPAAIHYVHRALAALLTILALGLVLMVRSRHERPVRVAGAWLLGLLFAQLTLGALTVMLSVPTALAVAHQGTALLLLSAAVALLHALANQMNAPDEIRRRKPGLHRSEPAQAPS